MKKENGIVIPESAREANMFIQQIGEFQARGQRIKQEEAEQIKRIRNRIKRRLTQGKKAIKRRFRGLYVYYQIHRAEILEKTKMLKLHAGSTRLLKVGPRVEVKNEERAVQILKQKGLSAFLTTKQVVDIKKVLANPKAVAGIKEVRVIPERENFIVTPEETKEAISEDVKKLKKFLS